MAASPTPRSGGRILVDALAVHGADLAFCVPGESYLEVLDAAVDVPAVRFVTCRQEGGAAFMAEAYGKLTGRPGICFVTRGPGACNASIGVHTAMQDSSPMILFVGQVGRDHVEREAFQEIDYRRMFGAVAKWAAQIDDARRIPEFVQRAFAVATSGRPGPVVLALPEDMLREPAAVADTRPYVRSEAHPGAGDMARMIERLSAAERPLVLVGGSGWSDALVAGLQAFAERNHLAVASVFRRQDLFSSRSASYVGDLGIAPDPKLVERVRAADLLLVVGARLDEITTQAYRLIEPPEPRQTLIHVYPEAGELGRVYRPELAIQAGADAFVAALSKLPPMVETRWRAWTEAGHADHLAWREPAPYDGALDLGQVFLWLRQRLPGDAVVTNDAGNFSGWGHRFLDYDRPGRQLGPINGAMGYAVPSAVAASLVHPERLVVAMVGDGGFLMTGQEIASALQAGAAPIILLFNNGMYGTIRMHQERRFPGRVSATDLVNPDFTALAKAYGAFGAAVSRTEDFAPAFEAAVASGRPAVIEIRMDPEVITTRTTLSALRQSALAGR